MSECPKFTISEIKQKIYNNTNNNQQIKSFVYARAVTKKVTNKNCS
jgi:hypothetical protein